MKKVIWYVLHNSPEIDAYMNEFQSERPDSDMQQEFPRWFESKIGNLYTAKDPRCTPDLFALACGPLSTATSINSCVVNGVKFVVHSRDVKRTTQNSGICSPGEKPGEMYYGQLEDILEFSYTQFKVVLFRVKWFDLAKREYVKSSIKHLHLFLRPINEFVKRARAAKIHAYIMNQLKKEMPSWNGKAKAQQRLIDNLDTLFAKTQRDHHLPAGGFPNVDAFSRSLNGYSIDKFERLKPKMIQGVDDDMLAYDIPKLLRTFRNPNK
ncbi:EF-hand domain pair [Artemisia annua]|uniref:EF-hand domain pair n=1 Tax=Artemisia annua TaxID=35608 RepID=A0A2U1P2V9_ARTAN|nr:EF-hand domain pair [Artemisia annua]